MAECTEVQGVSSINESQGTSHADGHTVIGRLAPSPTGRMHVGNAYAALAAWLAARATDGRIVLRIEDIDAPRVVSDADRWIMDDLAWLGLDWDGEPIYQSQRIDLYDDALRSLRSLDLCNVCHEFNADSENDSDTPCNPQTPLIYPCFCSRADIRAASAPNEGDGFLIYPGTCRCLDKTTQCGRISRGDRHSWRIAVPRGNAAMHFNDRVFGSQSFNLPQQLGDVVVKRSDGLFAYQLAVSVDDLLMGVTQIVRGRDLLRSTAVQLWIRQCLFEAGYMPNPATAVAAIANTNTTYNGADVTTMAQNTAATQNAHPWEVSQNPEFAHLPLIDAADGRRMAKRLNSLDMGTLREHGADPREVVGYCAWLLRIIDHPRPVNPTELIPMFSWDGLARDHGDRCLGNWTPMP